MADEIVNQVSATAPFHTGLHSPADGQPVVVFHTEASAKTLISYAHGQLEILSRTLRALSQSNGDDIGNLADALISIVDPASSALELAANRV